MLTDTHVSDGRVTHGSTLVFEDIADGPAPLRLRAYEDSLLRVVAGLIRLTTDHAEQLLRPGDEAIVPAGSCYRLASLSGTGRTLTGFRSPQLARDDRIT